LTGRIHNFSELLTEVTRGCRQELLASRRCTVHGSWPYV